MNDVCIQSNPWAYKEEGGRGVGAEDFPIRFFLIFFRDELSFPPAVFSSCAYIPYTHFDTRLVSIGCYGYEKWRLKQQVVKPFMKKIARFLPYLGEKSTKCAQIVFNFHLFLSNSQFGEIQDGAQDGGQDGGHFDDVIGLQRSHTPSYIPHLVEHNTCFLLKVRAFRNIVT